MSNIHHYFSLLFYGFHFSMGSLLNIRTITRLISQMILYLYHLHVGVLRFAWFLHMFGQNTTNQDLLWAVGWHSYDKVKENCQTYYTPQPRLVDAMRFKNIRPMKSNKYEWFPLYALQKGPPGFKVGLPSHLTIYLFFKYVLGCYMMLYACRLAIVKVYASDFSRRKFGGSFRDWWCPCPLDAGIHWGFWKVDWDVLVGGLEHVLFSHILGISIPMD